VSRSAWLVAAAITVGFFVAEYAPGKVASLYVESLGPLAAGCWLGFACQRPWRRGPETLARQSSPVLYALLAVSGMLLLLGGFRLFWVDPWLFGIAVAPLWEAIKILRGRASAMSS
jgi:hypothetical protein